MIFVVGTISALNLSASRAAAAFWNEDGKSVLKFNVNG